MIKRTMKNRLSNFITALKAEHIKKRGTGFYWTSAILGSLSPILYFIVSIVQSSEEIRTALPENYYFKFIEGSINPFGFFFFPLFIIIMVSRITQIDHKNGGWQLMETQPSYKFSIYFSKYTMILIGNLISIVTFIVLSLLSAWILTFIIKVPKTAIMEFPFTELLQITTRLFIGGLLITTFQFVISVLISSFIWSILIGFFGLLLTLFLSPFNLVPDWYPYQILSLVASNPKGSELGYWFLYTEYLGLFTSLIFLYFGFRWYQYKRFKLAFFKPTSNLISAFAVLLIGTLGIYWISKPNQMENQSQTIVCGKIDSDENLKMLYITDLIVKDTIAQIPIKNNEFKYVFPKSIITENYEFNIDRKYSGNLFFGDKDSIYIDGKIYNNINGLKIKGTRLAENNIKKAAQFDWSMAEYYINENHNLDKPDLISNTLYKEWKDAIALPNNYKTIDNYIPKSDFKIRSEKLITTKYLNLWNVFVEKRLAIYPNEKTVDTDNIKEIKKNLSLTDESLLTSNEYFEFVKSQLILKNKQDIDKNSKSIQEISKLKKGSFKDKMLYWQMSKNLEEASNTEERNQLIANYISDFENTTYPKKIVNFNRVIESLAKGKIAPELTATTTDGTTVTLSSLKGKYVLIDVWATWCGPCREQAPFFEKMALKYKKENIQFIALSVDENIQKWYIAAKGKSKSVMQIHTVDKMKLSKDYTIDFIPRFIFINPEGKFVNAKMSYPKEAAFELLLRKELNLPDEK